MNELKKFNINLGDFGSKIKSKFDSRYVKPKFVKELPTHKITVENAAKFAESIDLEPGMRIFAIVSGNFIFGDFVYSLIIVNSLKVKKLTISSLSLSEDNIVGLQYLLENGYVNELNVIISYYFYSHERNGAIKLMYEMLDIDNKFQLSVCRTHMKIVNIETENNKLTMHGSANMRSSDSIENITIEANDDVYDFTQNIFDTMISEFATIKKPLTNKQSWSAINKNKI